MIYGDVYPFKLHSVKQEFLQYNVHPILIYQIKGCMQVLKLSPAPYISHFPADS